MYNFDLLPKVDVEYQIHLDRYFKFILSRPERNLVKEKGYHIHHVIPEGLEGVDTLENKIKLTYREHFIAHMILYYCGYPEMIKAFSLMMHFIHKYGKTITLTSRQYQNLFINHKKVMSGENHPLYNTHHSEKSLLKMRESSPNTRKVMQIETKKIFISMVEAYNQTGVNKASISSCCRNERDTAGGFHWCYLEDYDENKEYKFIKNVRSSRKIILLETKEKFNSAKEASEKYNTDLSGIIACCKHKYKAYGNFHWLYLEDYDENKIYDLSFSDRKEVQNIDTGEIFESITEASKKYGNNKGFASSICLACQGKYKTAYGYHWKYI